MSYLRQVMVQVVLDTAEQMDDPFGYGFTPTHATYKAISYPGYVEQTVTLHGDTSDGRIACRILTSAHAIPEWLPEPPPEFVALVAAIKAGAS